MFQLVAVALAFNSYDTACLVHYGLSSENRDLIDQLTSIITLTTTLGDQVWPTVHRISCNPMAVNLMIQDVLFNGPFRNLPELTSGKLPRSRGKVNFFTRIETGQLIAGDFFLIGKQSGIENRRTQTTIRRQNGLLSIKGQMTADPLLATIRALFSPLGPWWSHM